LAVPLPRLEPPADGPAPDRPALCKGPVDAAPVAAFAPGPEP
jgi:hypothetical protein